MEGFRVFLSLLAFVALCSCQTVKPSCSHPVYCNTTILRSVHDHHLVKDSKTFVDMALRFSPSHVLANFDAMWDNGDVPSDANMQDWLRSNFHAVGRDLEPVDPEDFMAEPPLLLSISDVRMREWAMELNQVWRNLTRRRSAEADEHPDRYSLLNIQRPFVVPGGRFREFYYWDSYWTVTGLLSCNMHKTAKGVIENLLDLVNEYGFVPNGARIYYTERSQPPMLTEMVRHYVHIMRDTHFLRTALPTLEIEYNFWMNQRTVLLNSDGTVSHDEVKRSPDEVMELLQTDRLYRVNQYRAHSNVARPEGFKEDRKLVMKQLGVESYTASTMGTKLYRDIASACESGWDFSSRWTVSDTGDLTTLRTIDMIPVDLNAILFKNELLLSDFYQTLADAEEDDTKKRAYRDKVAFYQQAAEIRIKAIQKFLWVEEWGLWLDFNLERQTYIRSRNPYYASSLLPLWAGVARYEGNTEVDRALIEAKVLKTVRYFHLMNYTGGLPTSLIEGTKQQWDMPNSWPPMVMFAVDAMESIADGAGTPYALDLVSAFLSNAYNGWKEDHAMYEKYDVTTANGISGVGGEYEPQIGFAWTNGVVLELLLRFCTRGACVPINHSHELGAEEEGSFPWGAVAGSALALVALVAGALAVVALVVWWRRKRASGHQGIPTDVPMGVMGGDGADGGGLLEDDDGEEGDGFL